MGWVGGSRKPSSVPRSGRPRRGGVHSSRPTVTSRLERRTREHRTGSPRSLHNSVLLPDGVCLATPVTEGAGALLPHPFNVTEAPKRPVTSSSPHPEGMAMTRVPDAMRGGLLSVALSSGSPRPGVTWHPALGSSDFPPAGAAPSHEAIGPAVPPADTWVPPTRSAIGVARSGPSFLPSLDVRNQQWQLRQARTCRSGGSRPPSAGAAARGNGRRYRPRHQQDGESLVPQTGVVHLFVPANGVPPCRARTAQFHASPSPDDAAVPQPARYQPSTCGRHGLLRGGFGRWNSPARPSVPAGRFE